MASLEPPNTIQNFGESNLEDPGLQCRFALEPINVPENLHEDVLGDVGGFGRVRQHSASHLVNRSMIDTDEFIVSRIFVGLQTQDKQVLLSRQANCRLQLGICNFPAQHYEMASPGS